MINRIKLTWYLPALDKVLVLQKKKWWGWKTISWIYPEQVVGFSAKEIQEYLEWEFYKDRA